KTIAWPLQPPNINRNCISRLCELQWPPVTNSCRRVTATPRLSKQTDHSDGDMEIYEPIRWSPLLPPLATTLPSEQANILITIIINTTNGRQTRARMKN